MLKILLFCILSTLAVNAALAQTQPALRSEYPVSKARAVTNPYPKINLNENRCRFKHAAVKSTSEGDFLLEIVFEKKCDGKSNAILGFSNLEEAVMVKNLLLEEQNYKLFNLFQVDEKPVSFEIIYKNE